MKNNALAEAGVKTGFRTNGIFRSLILPFLLCLLLSVVIWLTVTNVTSVSDKTTDSDTATTVETV